MIYLFGTEHHLQRGISGKRNWTKTHFDEMYDEVCRTITSHNIKIVFEEMHVSVTEWKKTICERACEDLGIQARLIDLSYLEREYLAIDDWLRMKKMAEHAAAWLDNPERGDEQGRGNDLDEDEEVQKHTRLINEVRERIWIARIAKANIWPALVVCGANHVNSISQVIGDLGIDFDVSQEDYPDKIS